MEADSLQAFVPDAGLNIGRVAYKYNEINICLHNEPPGKIIGKIRTEIL